MIIVCSAISVGIFLYAYYKFVMFVARTLKKRNQTKAKIIYMNGVYITKAGHK